MDLNLLIGVSAIFPFRLVFVRLPIAASIFTAEFVAIVAALYTIAFFIIGTLYNILLFPELWRL